jgi:hypothetical protein
VTALENEDVDRIFGIPGEENLDVVESLRGSRIELVITRHEQAAAFMAATASCEASVACAISSALPASDELGCVCDTRDEPRVRGSVLSHRGSFWQEESARSGHRRTCQRCRCLGGT